MQGTYNRLGLHVSATPREVIAATLQKIAPRHRRSPEARADRHAIFRQMLQLHCEAQVLAFHVARGF